jgi:uncharacterized protein YndB with AHSA1/START domain
MSDDAVQAKTGKTWAEWFDVLDATGAAGLDHKGIVKVLAEQYHVGGWWQQMVTVTYEQARGKRVLHETTNGFQVSASKTIAAPAPSLYEAWVDETRRQGWLPDAPLVIRKATPYKSIRMRWADGDTPVDVAFYPKGEGRCQVTVQHSGLSNDGEGARMQAYWREALGRLGDAVKA